MSTLVNVVLSGSIPLAASMDHFLPAYSGKSLFQLCMERNSPFADRQVVIGHSEFYVQAKGNLKTMGNRTYLSIIEEDHLTNLYSVAFAAFSSGGEEILLVTPSYYMISNTSEYQDAITKMIRLAEQDMIGVLSFLPDQPLPHMPFLECDGDRVIAMELPKDNKQGRALSRSRNHVLHSGIYCCKSSVYLKELKLLAPEIFKSAQNIWKTRVGQYVAAESRIKVPYVSLEEILLLTSDKISIVVQAASRVHIKDNHNQADEADSSGPDVSAHDGNGPQAMGLAM